ncbi:hypothetical protein VHEMI04154 [[Torrubiella] hemipterigena]|uniref:Methyltransferase domain-containing protein n=1 Tax=[Torrubiella] hemipterigena TaxID=1531966 RepID=A0A0A1TD27_9HYPO|nr:hypothetical protein VHEMI04154 [[Torrubiella] hemipterigena]
MDEDRRFWDRLATNYSKSKVSDELGYQRTLQRTSDFLKASDAVLELGCGTGSTAFLLAPKVKGILATDISPEMIRIARQKQQDEPTAAYDSISFKEATADTIAKENHMPFNAILGYNYLHLVRDPPATVQKIHGMLEDGGVFISKTPCIGDRNMLMRSFVLPTMRIFGLAPYLDNFGATELVTMIKTAGFQIEAEEKHASGSDDGRVFIVARKMESGSNDRTTA